MTYMEKEELIKEIKSLVEEYQASPNYKKPIFKQGLQVHWHFVGWGHLSLGFHVCLDKNRRNIEIHLPFGFLRIGQQDYLYYDVSINI